MNSASKLVLLLPFLLILPTTLASDYEITGGPFFQFDPQGNYPVVMVSIDSFNHLCVYADWTLASWAVILTADPITGSITKGTPLQFEPSFGINFALEKIDANHYLCVYAAGNRAKALVLTVDITTNTVSMSPPVQFGDIPAEITLSRIDNNRHLCSYTQVNDPKGIVHLWARVLTVDPINWTVAVNPEYEISSPTEGKGYPKLCRFDDTHHLLAFSYGDPITFTEPGKAIILKVDPINWTVTEMGDFTFAPNGGGHKALERIDHTHYLCCYFDEFSKGWAVVLTVDPLTWDINRGANYEYANVMGDEPFVSRIDATHFLCTYRNFSSTNPSAFSTWSTVLTVETNTDTVIKEIPVEIETSPSVESALSRIDESHYLCAHIRFDPATFLFDGWASVLRVELPDETLLADTSELSDSLGGIVNFDLKPGSAHGGGNYLIFAGVTGASPGFHLPGGDKLHLNWDLFTSAVIANSTGPVFSNFLGTLNPMGEGAAQLNTLGPINSGMVGLKLYFALAVEGPVWHGSNSVLLEITP